MVDEEYEMLFSKKEITYLVDTLKDNESVNIIFL